MVLVDGAGTAHIGRLFEQREMLMRAVEALLKADRTQLSGVASKPTDVMRTVSRC
jgi:hypothetical protein